MKGRQVARMGMAVLSTALLLGACGESKAPGVKSGYDFATPETKAMQDDDFVNPGMLIVPVGEQLWTKVEGDAGKSCSSCHGDAKVSMKGVAAHFPKFDADAKKPINLELQINKCRKNAMKATEYKYESNEMLGMTTFIALQSRGMPMEAPDIDGPMKPFFEKGKALYFERRGLLDMACKHCHEENAGNKIRANLLSQGQINGFPTYRLKWQKVGSLHRRLRGCNSQVRAEPFGFGSDEYVNLEVFLSWRGRGLPIEAPSVRN